MVPLSKGKNQARPGSSPTRGPPVAVRRSAPPSSDTRASIPAGRGAPSTTVWIAAPWVGSNGAAPSRTGRLNRSVSSSGTHISSLQTRNRAATIRGTVVPGRASAGISIGTGR